MQRFVVLLRGVNVGGKKLPMATLRDVLESIGCGDVSTYIQSGNAFVSTSLSAQRLATTLQDALEKEIAFAPKVMTRTSKDLDAVIKSNPFPQADERFLHVGFLSKKPTKASVAELKDLDVAPEQFELIGKELFLNYVNGAGRSEKLGKIKFEKLLGVDITARNFRTVRKLQEMV